MIATVCMLIGGGGFWIAGYMIGRVHGYDRYDQIEKESKVWVMK